MKNFIKERDKEMTYLELRILTMIDCKPKHEKITELINFLKRNDFLCNLTYMLEDAKSDNFTEFNNRMSISVDLINEKLRFKFWNGASTQYLYHVSDLCNALDTGREEFTELYDKYEPVTEALYEFARKWQNSIYSISYDYLADKFDIIYTVTFTQDVKERDYTNIMLSKMSKEIEKLGTDVTKDLNFKLIHEFKSTCTPCEQARKERERRESQNDKGQSVEE